MIFSDKIAKKQRWGGVQKTLLQENYWTDCKMVSRLVRKMVKLCKKLHEIVNFDKKCFIIFPGGPAPLNEKRIESNLLFAFF